MVTKKSSKPVNQRKAPTVVPGPVPLAPVDYAQDPVPTGQTPQESFKERVIRWLKDH